MVQAPPVSPTKTVIRWAPLVFLSATAIGVLLRLAFVGVPLPAPFDHLLHSHSHALYFGWAGIVILGSAIDDSRGDRLALAGLILVAPMTVAFWAQGYGPISIAFSTLVMFAWYGAVYQWWRSGRNRDFAASLAYVVLASLGVWVLAPLQMLGRGDGLAGALAIHAFLATFAWSLVLGTLTFLARAGYETTGAARWWTSTAWALFPLGVLGGPEAFGLGPISRLAGLAGLVPAYLVVRALWRSPLVLRLAAWWLAATAAGLALVAVGGSEILGVVGRAGTVFYLHALLLGYVSTVLVWYLAERLPLNTTQPLLAHHVGVAAMLAGVLVASRYPSVGNWVAAIGAIGVWMAAWGWALPLYRRSA